MQLSFEESADVGMDADALSSRQQKEAQSLQALHTTASKVKSVEQLHHFLFVEHRAYNAAGAAAPRAAKPVISAGAVSTY